MACSGLQIIERRRVPPVSAWMLALYAYHGQAIDAQAWLSRLMSSVVIATSGENPEPLSGAWS